MITYRKMVPEDLGEVKKLHEDWFPISYNEDFYESVANGTSFGIGGHVFCVVAVWTGEVPWSRFEAVSDNEREKIIGVVSAQVQPLSSVGDGGLPLPRNNGQWEGALYILTLGTDERYRRQGVGKELIARAIQFAHGDPTCMAVYLHVITYNSAAIDFYKYMGFRIEREIPDYYEINSKRYGCLLCIKYVNGAKDPAQSVRWIQVLLSSIGNFFEILYNFVSSTPREDAKQKKFDDLPPTISELNAKSSSNKSSDEAVQCAENGKVYSLNQINDNHGLLKHGKTNNSSWPPDENLRLVV